MKDFKNNPEITENIEHFIDDGSEIKMSLIVSPWNVAHLLIRSIETWCKQDINPAWWELIVISDNSDDDVYGTIKQAIGKINLRFIKLSHNYGMRGNTVAYNTGFAWARGFLLCETTGETMFTTDMMRRMYEPHLTHPKAFVAIKTWNLTTELQLQIDNVNWMEDIGNIMQLPGFFNDWTLNNFKNPHFGTHQTCSIRKDVFYEIFPNGYPLYCDYGSEDARFCGVRPFFGVKDITIMQPMAVHQWHCSWHWWGSLGKAPNCNKHGHTIRNVMNDMSIDENGNRTIPDGGTCCIWDGGSTEGYSPEQIADQRTWDERVRATGCNIV